MGTTAFVAATLAICLGSLYAGFRAVSLLFEILSGWRRLEGPFGCEADARLWTHRGQTVQLRAIRLRRVVDAGVRPEGLYLRAGAIFQWRPLRIPWSEMSAFEPATIYRRAAMKFQVNGVALAVDAPLYAAMYPHLAAHHPAAPAGRAPR